MSDDGLSFTRTLRLVLQHFFLWGWQRRPQLRT